MTAPTLPRCSTGVPGLDDVLSGGLPRDCLYLVEGLPGVGKTTLALQFLMEGLRQGETSLYVTLSETRRELDAVAASHGWDLGRLSLIELSNVADAIGSDAQNTLFHSAEVELAQLAKLLLDAIERIRPRRVVLDSLSEMRLLAQSPLRYRREVLRLKQRLADQHCTVLLLDDSSSHRADIQVHSLVHGVLALESAPLKYGLFRRSLSVTKLRGVSYREGSHDYVIQRGGITTFPRLVAAEHDGANFTGAALSGNVDLDALLGGGLHYGTNNLIIGPAGSGKSTIASQFSFAAAARGERVNYYVFDETRKTLFDRAEAMRISLRQQSEAGRLKVYQMDPAQVSPGDLAARIRHAVEVEGVRVIVLDSLNGYITAMPHEEYLHLHLHELLTYLNQQGVMTLMVLAQHGLFGPTGAPIDVSYLADSVIITRFFEALGSIRKAISIIKKRSGPHEAEVRELKMTVHGVFVGPPLTEFQGVLTGVPAYLGVERGGRLNDAPSK